MTGTTAGTTGIPRRGFLRRGIFGGVLLFVSGATGLALRSTRTGSLPRGPLKLLSPAEYAVLAAVAARVIPSGGTPAWPSPESVDCVGKIDALLATTHPTVGEDFKRLLGLFENALFGLVATRQPTPFTRLSAEEQDRRLEAWRSSRLMLLRSGYQAMVRLVHATYFSSPEVYPFVGYPGPPVVPA